MTRASRPGTNHKKNGGTLTVVGFLCQTWAVWLHGLSIETRIVLGLLGLLMSCSGAFLFWRGCQYDAKADTERIITDHNPHVLYLRAFLSDSSTRKFILSTAVMAFPQATLEEQLADVVRPLGDLVAIGRPGEGLPEPGAARMYASDEEWKEVVNRRQLLAARLVIIRAGVGENLLWEAKHAVETLSPEKVLIFVFNMKAKDYESFRTKATQTLAVSLPELMRLRPFFGRVSGFIDFGTDWKPSVLPLPRFPHLYFRISSFKPYLAQLKFALRPVFERFGLEWRPPPLLWGQVVTVTLALAVSLMLILFYIRPK